MAIFNSYVSLPEGMHDIFYCLDGVHIKVLGGASHLVNGLRNTVIYGISPLMYRMRYGLYGFYMVPMFIA